MFTLREHSGMYVGSGILFRIICGYRRIKTDKMFDNLNILFIFAMKEKTSFKYKIGVRQGPDDSLLILVLN